MAIRKSKPRDKHGKLAKKAGVIVGDPGRLPHVKTFDETKWRRKWHKRPK
jgi:hypothetical protein